MTSPAVSVIVPTYNRSWGLKRAVAGVLAQTFADFEVVIADDASADDTPDVARSFADPRVVYFRQPANVGVARNWGAGLARAAGAFVCFLMDDDWYEETFLARRVAALRESEQIVCAFSGYRRLDEAGNQVATHAPALPTDRDLEGDEFLKAALGRAMFVGATMYRAGPVKELWPRAEEHGLIADYAATIRLALLPGAAARFLPGADFVMSDHPEQLSHARAGEVFRQVTRFLARLLAETAGRGPRRLIRGELTGWYVQQAVRARQRGERRAALGHLLGALKYRPASWPAWKQLARVTTGF